MLSVISNTGGVRIRSPDRTTISEQFNLLVVYIEILKGGNYQ